MGEKEKERYERGGGGIFSVGLSSGRVVSRKKGGTEQDKKRRNSQGDTTGVFLQVREYKHLNQ